MERRTRSPRATDKLVDGRLTGATNGDVGYHVGQANPTSLGDWLHIESTNTTVRIVDWFESLSGVEPPDGGLPARAADRL